MLIPKTILSWMKKQVTNRCKTTNRRLRITSVPAEILEDRTVLTPYTVTLAADPPSGSAIGQSQIVTYTITITNGMTANTTSGDGFIRVFDTSTLDLNFQFNPAFPTGVMTQPGAGSSAWGSATITPNGNGTSQFTVYAGDGIGGGADTFAANQTVVLKLDALVSPRAAPNSVQNNTAFFETDLDGNGIDEVFIGSNKVSLTVAPDADLAISKTSQTATPLMSDPQHSVVAGGTSVPFASLANLGNEGTGNISYVLNVSNIGSNNATNVVIEDEIPGGPAKLVNATPVAGPVTGQPIIPAFPAVTSVSLTDDTGGAPVGTATAFAIGFHYEGGLLILTPGVNTAINPSFIKGILPAGFQARIAYRIQVDASATSNSIVGNSARIYNAGAVDINAGNNTSLTTQNVVITKADLGITVVRSNPTPIAGGAAFSYTITVTNNGPSDATNVVVNDPLPPSVIFQNISVVGPGAFALSGPAVGTNGLVSCTSSVFPAGSVTTFTIVAQIVADAASGVRTNTATATSATKETTPNVAPNSASVQVNIVNDASLSIAETGPTTVFPGQIFTYQIAVTNSGNSSSLNTVVTDTLPPNTTFLNLFGSKAFADKGTYDEATRTVTFGASVLSTGTHTIDITVQLAPDAIIGTLTNSTMLTTAVGTITGTNPASTSATITGGLAIYGDQDVVNQDDFFLITRTGGTLQVFLNTILQFSAAIGDVPKISIFGLGGNDELIVDSTNGLINVTNGIRYNGGSGFDKLTLTQTGGATQTSSTYNVGPSIGSGKHTIVGASGTQAVFFENLEPVVDLVPALSLVVNGTPEANAINYTQGAVATNGKVAVDNYESIEFSNKTTLTINAQAGNDVINLSNSATPTALTTITVNGDEGNDELTSQSGTAAAVNMNGGVGNDLLDASGVTGGPGTLSGGNGNDTLISGSGNETINGGAGTDRVVAKGDVNFTLTNTTLTGLGTDTLVSIETASLEGGDSDNTFTIGAFTGNTTVTGAGGADTLNFSTATAAINIDLDIIGVDQVINLAQRRLNLGDVVENLTATSFNDLINVDIGSFDRTINGGPETSIPPGDTLIIDLKGANSTIVKNPNLPKVGSFEGSVKGAGYLGTVFYDDIETLTIKNAGPGGGFGGAGGPFLAATDYLVGKGPRGVQLGQLNDDNGDGFINDLDNLDMVTANSGSKNITVRMGTGFGTFGPATHFASGGYGVTVALGDLNGDGDLDAVVTLQSIHKLGVLLGNGDGTFAAPKTFTTGTNKYAKNGLLPTSVKLADFNGDTVLDAVTANAGSNTVSVLLGDGAGGFGPVGSAKTFKTGGTTPRDLVAADFNQDGNVDVVVTNLNSKNVSFFSGNGNGTLNAAVKFATGTQPTSIVAADFNADGNLDIACTNQFTKNISILLGNGAGGPLQFQEQLRIHYPLIAFDVSLAVGDFNGDGVIDLAIANRLPNTLSILLGFGNGTFTNRFDNSVGEILHRQPVSIAVGDLNHDGGLDVIVANPGTNDVSVLLRNTIL